jgi:hypothetical protein
MASKNDDTLSKQDPTKPYSALLYSGGGLRAYAAAAVFTLALQQTPEAPGAQRSVYECFMRQFGVSGGGWFVLSQTHGLLAHMDPSWTIDSLIQQLTSSHAIRAGDFDARTEEIHRRLAPKLDKVAVEWSEACCWCPACCDCMQWMIGCCHSCYRCCCCEKGARYPLSELLNVTAGDAFLCALAPDPLTALGDLIAPIVLGPKEAVDGVLKCFDNSSGTMVCERSRGFDASKDGSANSGGGRVMSHPAAFVDCALEAPGAAAPDSELEYYHIYLRVTESAQAYLVNPPGKAGTSAADHEEGSVVITKNVPLRSLIATIGSAFSVDARSFIERGPLSRLADIVPDFPFSSKTLFGESSVRKIHISDPEGRFKKIADTEGGIARLRDAGVDLNVSFPAVLSPLNEWVFVLDNGAGGEFGGELVIAQRRGILGEYKWIHRSAPCGWGIALKQDPEAVGPTYIVYIMGLNDPETVNVRDAGDRIRRLRALYALWVKEIPVIVSTINVIKAHATAAAQSSTPRDSPKQDAK